MPRAFGPHKAVLEYAGELEHVRRPRPLGGDDDDELHLPVRDGAGLSRTMISTTLVDSSTLAALDQHADLGAAAAADQESGRRGQAQGARQAMITTGPRQ